MPANRIELERRLAEKLVVASDTEMQIIAEEFARIRYPKRFSRIQVFGRNAQAQATIGWPDAGVVHPDGRVDAVEATRARGQDWRDHIKEDLEKAKGSNYPNLLGFIFVAGHPEARCSPDEQTKWRKEFVSAGVPEENIDVIVGMDLVRCLCNPDFARLASEILHIPPNPNHFRLVFWTQEIERLGAFEPTRREFLDGLVHRPVLADEIIKRLNEKQWAVTLGSGASGKTSLGYLLTLDPSFRYLPSYLINIANYQEFTPKIANETGDDFLNFSDPQLLFIVDNIHLNEDLTQEIYDSWKNLSVTVRPKLLFLGRQTKYHKGSRFVGPLVSPLILRAREAEVLGVFRRLANRRLGYPNQNQIELPDPDTVAGWVRTFGGNPERENTTVDLMALSAAIQNRIDDLLAQKWTLTEADARQEIRRHLKIASQSERRNLIRLATMPEDFSLPDVAMAYPNEAFPESTRRGLVFETKKGRIRRNYYDFVHSALGRLMKAAVDDLPDTRHEYCDVATRSPNAGFSLAGRLIREGNEADAAATLESILSKADWLSRMEGHLGHLRVGIELLNTLKISSYAQIDSNLSKQKNALIQLGVQTPVDSLSPFLSFAKSAGMQSTYQIVTEQTPVHPAFSEAALRVHLHFISDFLKYTEEERLSLLFRGIVFGLQNNPESLLRAALKTQLNDLVSFLKYADRDELQDVRRALISGLEKQVSSFVVIICNSPFDFVANFLNYAAHNHFRSLYDKIGEALLTPESIAVMASRACREPGSSLANFLDVEPYASKIATAIDLNEWNKSRMEIEADQPTFFAPLMRKFAHLGRPELAEALARAQVAGKRAETWSASALNIVQLTHILRLAKPNEHELNGFLSLVVTADWLKKQYRDAKIGTIAGALFAIVTNLPRDHWSRFLHPSLRERVRAELESCDPAWPLHWPEALSALGALAALGGDTTSICVVWPRKGILADVMACRSEGANNGRISILELQLWSGLREMARLNSDSIAIAPIIGEQILSKARENLPFARSGGMTVELIEWLEGCKAAGWTLSR